MATIHLNMDLGEGIANESLVMQHITSCNVACGGHYGDDDSMKATLALAKTFGVLVGAHPSFEDKENFGRVQLVCDESRFRESVTTQIQAFQKVAAELDIKMNHVKMHGALYHATAHQTDFVEWTLLLMQEFYNDVPLVVPYGCLLAERAQEVGIQIINEAFADRRYLKNGRLVSRERPDAVITDIPKLVNQLSSMVKLQQVQTVEEEFLAIKADLYCIHGDNVEIVSQFEELKNALNQNGISIA
ncbi:MAG: LamB/YcsF family protein [Nonlabens sp.]|nr:LamB/YcsF family protein [Nonlabens sp.]